MGTQDIISPGCMSMDCCLIFNTSQSGRRDSFNDCRNCVIVRAMLKRDQRVVPLYYQAQHTISQRISRGEYAPGSQLPSESELSRELGVSRVTVREALRVLAQEGLLVKVQGKGTFVSDNAAVHQPTRSFTGSLEDLYDQLERV